MFDAHGFDASVPLVLGGVEFPDTAGLSGHSDGDVVAHALIDALLGAANLGDIGAMFPSDDDELAGISRSPAPEPRLPAGARRGV